MSTKYCKYCRTEIDKKATVCPNCQRKQSSGCLTAIGAVFIVLFALIFIPPFINGCTAGYDHAKNQDNSARSSVNNNAHSDENSKSNSKSTSVSIADHYLTQNSSGETVLVVKYDFYNGEDEPKNFAWTVNDKCFQNGIECQEEYFLDEVDTSKQTADIQPGITLNLSVAYKLSDTSDVNIVVTKLIGDDEFINETFSVK